MLSSRATRPTCRLLQTLASVARSGDIIHRGYASEAPDSAVHRSLSGSLLDLPLAHYGGRQTVTSLTGDGIGPEMLGHIRDLFKFAQVPVDFEEVALDSKQGVGEDDLENAIVSIQRNGAALKGNIETKFDPAAPRSRNVVLRTRLDLFANVLWCRSVPTIETRHTHNKPLDIIIIRENTEGEYSGIEHETVPGVVESLKIVTRENIDRIARFAFDYATQYGRKKVTAVHKANIMKLGDGLFLRACEEMAAKYPKIQFDNMIIDNASMQLVSDPHQFDVIVLPNLYGNILSNIACGLVGGPGLLSGINIGRKYAVFETGSRNTGTAIAGKDIANPTAFLRAATDLLYYLGRDTHAELFSGAINETLCVKRIRTRDLGGSHSTSDYIESVREFLDKTLQNRPI